MLLLLATLDYIMSGDDNMSYTDKLNYKIPLESHIEYGKYLKLIRIELFKSYPKKTNKEGKIDQRAIKYLDELRSVLEDIMYRDYYLNKKADEDFTYIYYHDARDVNE